VSHTRTLHTHTTGRTVPVVAYNTLGVTRTTYLRLDVPRADVEAVDNAGAPVPSQINEKARTVSVYLHGRPSVSVCVGVCT
jgi:hypothetical protein